MGQQRATPAREPEDYRARVEAFRAKHEQDYRRDFVTRLSTLLRDRRRRRT
jgi:hypothetical protein